MNRRRIFIFVAAVMIGGGIAVGTAFLNIMVSHELYKYQERRNQENSASIGSSLNKRLQMIEDAVEINGMVLGDMPAITGNTVEELLEQSFRRVTDSELGICGMSVALEPDVLEDGLEAVMFYIHHDGEKKISSMHGSKTHPYATFPWYCVPKYLEQTVWSEPYRDSGTSDVLMATCSMPFYRSVGGVKRFAGVTTADIRLTQLQRFLNSRQGHDFKYMFMISKFGRLLSSQDISMAMTETIYSVAYERSNVEMGERFKRDSEEGLPGVIRIEHPFLGIRNGNMYYVPLAANEWSLVMVYDLKTHRQYVRNITWLLIFSGLGFFGVFMTVVVLVSRRLSGENNKKRS